MDPSESHYVHGTAPEEQRRLSRLNALLNAGSLDAMALSGGEKILDVGSGLGQFTRILARKVGPTGRVLGVERDPEQIRDALRQAREVDEEHLLELRHGDATHLPLEDGEWGSFDIAHSRFVLEHVTDPLAVVRSMVRAVRPGGRIIVEDDDHDVLRLWPDPPGVLGLWKAYYTTYELQGKNPAVGRHLVSLLHEAGAKPKANRLLFFGSCAGNPNFEAMVANFIGVIESARTEMINAGLATKEQIDEGLSSFGAWQKNPDAAMWYTTSWAEGARPSPGAAKTAPPLSSSGDDVDGRSSPAPATTPHERSDEENASLLRFLMDSAAELSSSLKLESVFHKIAQGIRPLIDYHLFCVMLWNERTQLLENSFSMKYGEAIPQKGGFPLGYGISGSAAVLRQPIRVSNVLEDSRYVRFRHPEVEIHSELAVPLLFKDQLIGVVDLESTEYDYFTEEHQQIVSTLASHIATALVNARLFETVRRGERRLERDLATAREIQTGLLPRRVPHSASLSVGSAYAPAKELGGDFYDFQNDRNGHLALAVGDVAGKATGAALLGSLAVGMLRGHLVEHPRAPEQMLAELNEQLLEAGGDNRFVAMSFAIYDEGAKRLRLANAGMPRALLVRNGTTRETTACGVPLGMFPGTRYRPETLELHGGDVLVFCSDGLMECENERGDAFGSSELQRVLEELVSLPAQEIAQRLNRAALEFCGAESEQADDYTVVALKIV
jgi:serine phosphatase RsbU (regulator of sigma subunit)/ubiquinone/menaquinone biosynthesis C-methylase UbiE